MFFAAHNVFFFHYQCLCTGGFRFSHQSRLCCIFRINLISYKLRKVALSAMNVKTTSRLHMNQAKTLNCRENKVKLASDWRNTLNLPVNTRRDFQNQFYEFIGEFTDSSLPFTALRHKCGIQFYFHN